MKTTAEIDRPDKPFRPKLGGRVPRSGGGSTFKNLILRHIAGTRATPGSHARSPARRASRHVHAPGPLSRRVVIKARYVTTGRGGAKAAQLHLRYIEREGVERDGSKGKLFDAHGDVDRVEFGAEIEGEKRQFRFIVSPEDGAELDLRDFARRLVGRMEKDLGRELRWAAVCHHDTDNPHVHLVVRGVDKHGEDVRIDRGYISDFMRRRAQELATMELGPRQEWELDRQRNQELTKERFTGLDRGLAAEVSPDGTLQLADVVRARHSSREHALTRMETLVSLGLAERLSKGSWRMEDGWQESLKQMGERNDIIKRMHRALGGDPSFYRVFDPTKTGVLLAIKGVVKHKGLHDELGGDFFVIVEDSARQPHYVRMDRERGQELREGERIKYWSIADSWVKGPDAAIEREAALNSGVYNAALHQKKLGRSPIAMGSFMASAEEVVAANQRRLARLERHNLVVRVGEGIWKVPQNLVQQLQDRERTHPRFLLQIDRPDFEIEQKQKRERELEEQRQQRERELQRERKRERGPDLDLGLEIGRSRDRDRGPER